MKVVFDGLINIFEDVINIFEGVININDALENRLLHYLIPIRIKFIIKIDYINLLTIFALRMKCKELRLTCFVLNISVLNIIWH